MKVTYKNNNSKIMKKLIYLLILILSTNYSFSQDQKRKKIKALKATYITTELDLSTSEAEKFWPIYNTSEKKNHELRNESRLLRKNLKENFEIISESDAKIILKKSIKLRNEMHQERNDLITKLIKFLPAKKIILLKKTEDDFTRKLLKRFKNKRNPKNEKGTPPPR